MLTRPEQTLIENKQATRFVHCYNQKYKTDYQVSKYKQPQESLTDVVLESLGGSSTPINLQLTQAIPEQVNWGDGRLYQNKTTSVQDMQEVDSLFDIVRSVEESVDKKIENHKNSKEEIELLLVLDNLYGNSVSRVIEAIGKVRSKYEHQQVFKKIWILFTEESNEGRDDRIELIQSNSTPRR